jgi:hypothetical protein
MKLFKELNMDNLIFMWLSLIFLGAFAGISYENYLDSQTRLRVLQCIEKTQRPELCNKVFR